MSAVCGEGVFRGAGSVQSARAASGCAPAVRGTAAAPLTAPGLSSCATPRRENTAAKSGFQPWSLSVPLPAASGAGDRHRAGRRGRRGLRREPLRGARPRGARPAAPSCLPLPLARQTPAVSSQPPASKELQSGLQPSGDTPSEIGHRSGAVEERLTPFPPLSFDPYARNPGPHLGAVPGSLCLGSLFLSGSPQD